ncbi:Crp/Fnr family transcriptional regulator [Paenibacillus lutimineralis]|uniref:Crp/Fnr family transcriptional regulator n=2 Tax=Paenibacillus lutimineralis TaxID=2707005 RepID=A0A3Q9I9D4_9BACL|nr:Crp/Fnr family transcriptional regulator [Paenibacillus lutimineralis]
MMLPSDIQRISLILPFLSSIPEKDWSQAEIRTVTSNTPHSIREGHLLQHAMFILKGSVRIYKVSEQGREVTLYRVQDGQSCVLMMASILGEVTYEASASIEVETEVLLVPVQLFKRWIDTYEPPKQFVFKQIIQRITSVMDLLENVAFRSISYRIADFLINQSTAHDAIIKITHEQLAIELGTAREVISRALKDFANKNILVSRRGYLQIVDRGRLLQILSDEAM